MGARGIHMRKHRRGGGKAHSRTASSTGKTLMELKLCSVVQVEAKPALSSSIFTLCAFLALKTLHIVPLKSEIKMSDHGAFGVSGPSRPTSAKVQFYVGRTANEVNRLID